MTSELLEIHPQQLNFTFELKKQSSCLIQLTNNTDQYVAFKVKTTSPKKYCVRPNTGIVKPKSTYDFTVTMQAQSVAPPDLMCKDKFLIQSTVIPLGTAEEDISNIFSKESGRDIEEKKLKVFLTSPPQSPVLTAINGDLKQEMDHETSPRKDKACRGVENIPPPQKVAEDLKGFETAKDALELRSTTDVERFKTSVDDSKELTPASNVQSSIPKDVQGLKCTKEMKLDDNFEKLKSKISFMDSKLKEAEVTIVKLTQERSMADQEKDKLQGELEALKTNSAAGKTIQVGFPFFYVCVVAIMSLVIGYLSHL
ncbi:Vesicle-associated protein 1-3 [Hibiscus syriacus]|uniref:Vesicle-associated protein 1-3 n=1 Tax=Hibiscus syriacus TaxID=106335 RepID=A0A6A2WLX4_HIBSY|nr:vesicle-associated protein 2-2-like isoform X2 [Hibiscus syriacus]KAE8660121.1 Vesicle-associated protein 1-3 [Hibiscus syriacus]